MAYEKYRQLCEERGLTSYAVSKATGIPQSTLSTWKTSGHSPKVETLQKLAAYFGVSVLVFLE